LIAAAPGFITSEKMPTNSFRARDLNFYVKKFAPCWRIRVAGKARARPDLDRERDAMAHFDVRKSMTCGLTGFAVASRLKGNAENVDPGEADSTTQRIE
jgi:hypothetical protein